MHESAAGGSGSGMQESFRSGWLLDIETETSWAARELLFLCIQHCCGCYPSPGGDHQRCWQLERIKNWKMYCNNNRKTYIATKFLFSLTKAMIVQTAQMMKQPVSGRVKRNNLPSHSHFSFRFLLSSVSSHTLPCSGSCLCLGEPFIAHMAR